MPRRGYQLSLVTECPGGEIGKLSRLIDNLSALLETVGVEPVKFGEDCKMLIPSEVQKWKRVETRRRAPVARAMVKV